jgi:hypothetical protein
MGAAAEPWVIVAGAWWLIVSSKALVVHARLRV